MNSYVFREKMNVSILSFNVSAFIQTDILVASGKSFLKHFTLIVKATNFLLENSLTNIF